MFSGLQAVGGQKENSQYYGLRCSGIWPPVDQNENTLASGGQNAEWLASEASRSPTILDLGAPLTGSISLESRAYKRTSQCEHIGPRGFLTQII